MNNERTIILENVGGQAVGLKDTQGRTYRLSPNAKIRISKISLQDILDYPASKIIFNEDLVKISNVNAEDLYNMGLTEDEIEKFTLDNLTISIGVVTEDLKEDKKIIVETKKKTTEKKNNTTKSNAKKTSTSKSNK